MKNVFLLSVIISLTACATVRQQDVDAWAGVPVEALDTHSRFITIPMYKTVTDSGIEIRNYANTKESASCFATGNANVYQQSGNPYAVSPSATVQSTAISNCISQTKGCNNIFYIKDGVVLEYAPTGNCYTNASAQPEARYKQLMSK